MIEPMLTAREVAEILGFTPGTIVDWAEDDKIPHFKVGGRLRFRESEVADWLEERRQGRRGEERATEPPPAPDAESKIRALPSPRRNDDG